MRLRPVRLAAVTLAVSVGLVAPAAASPTEDRIAKLDASADRLRSQISETSDALSRAADRLDRTRDQLAAARTEVFEARRDLRAAQERNAELGRELAAAKAREQAAVRQLARIVAEMEQTQALIGAMARRAYQTGDVSQLAVVLQAESPDDLASRLVLVESVLRTENDVFELLDAKRAEVAERRARLQAERERIAALKAEAAALVERTRELRAQAEAAQRRVSVLVERARAATAALEAEKAAEEGRLAEMEAESARLQAVLAERARQQAAAAAAASRSAHRSSSSVSSSSSSSSRSSSSSSSGFVMPVNGYVTSRFGMRVHPVTGVYKLHDGLDFGAGCGTPIYAAASGTVVQASYAGGYGNQVVLDHGNGLATSYSHMSGFAVSGGSVSQGQVVGYVGNTGYSTGCHLHFMVYSGGSPQNPENYL